MGSRMIKERGFDPLLSVAQAMHVKEKEEGTRKAKV